MPHSICIVSEEESSQRSYWSFLLFHHGKSSQCVLMLTLVSEALYMMPVYTYDYCYCILSYYGYFTSQIS